MDMNPNVNAYGNPVMPQGFTVADTVPTTQAVNYEAPRVAPSVRYLSFFQPSHIPCKYLILFHLVFWVLLRADLGRDAN